MRKVMFDRKTILSAAIKLAEEVGFKKLSMRSVARELQCSVMPVYSAYNSKQLLIEDIYNEIIKKNLKSKDYRGRNKDILITGIRNPILYKDITIFGPLSYKFDQLYSDTMELMKLDPKFSQFSHRVCESIHFDIMIYINGLIERKVSSGLSKNEFEAHCLTILEQFTELLIMGYEKGISL